MCLYIKGAYRTGEESTDELTAEMLEYSATCKEWLLQIDTPAQYVNGRGPGILPPNFEAQESDVYMSQ